MSTLSKVEFIHGLNMPVDALIANIKSNCAREHLPQFKTRRAILIAGGPSANDHIEDIKAKAADGAEVWCVNGAHDWLRRACGIRPAYAVVMDASPVVDSFIKNPLDGVTYLVASQTHPNLIDRLERLGSYVVMWHAALNAEAHAIMGDVTITAPANTVGLHALQLMCLSGVRHATIYGMDSSHRPDADHAYDNSHQHAADELEFVYGGKVYMATGTWAAQAHLFRQMYPRFFRAGLRIDVVGDGLLPAMWADARDAFYSDLKQQQKAAA